MGRMKDWLIDMEDDATHMDRGSWEEKHGSSNVDIFHGIQMDMYEHEIENALQKMYECKKEIKA